MDLHGVWQEHKPFLLSVAGGVVLFFGAWWGIDSSLGKNSRKEATRIARAQADLRKEFYSARDLQLAKGQNEALRAALGDLSAACEFHAREGFAAGKGASVESQYIATVYRVREELLQLAGRANLVLPKDLGLAAQAPTRPTELQRSLECLDAVDRFVRIALDCGYARIEEIKFTIDARVRSGKPIADIEQNLVRIKAVAHPRAIASSLIALRRPSQSERLLIKTLDVTPSRSKVEELVIELELAVLHPPGLADLSAPEGSGSGAAPGRATSGSQAAARRSP